MATLLEVIEYVEKYTENSVTSSTCQWKKKERQAADCPVEVEKLTTRLNMNETARSEVPSTDYYDPCPGVPLPNVDDFYNGIKKLRPNANILYNRFKYGKSPDDVSKSPISSFFEKFSAP